MEYFMYCPSCKKEKINELAKEPKMNRYGTDGYGQPVGFTDCECGSEMCGYLELSFYARNEPVNDGLIRYLKHRINFYYEGFKEDEKVNKEVKEETIKCRPCGGSGRKSRTVVIGTIVTSVYDTCRYCHGSGEITKKTEE